MENDIYCETCGSKLEYRINSEDNIIVRRCKKWPAEAEYMMFLNFLHKHDVIISDPVSIEKGLELLTKELGYLDMLEEIIDKIIPEYRNVPMEYKILLFKERINNTYIVSKKYSLNEEQINELTSTLVKNYKIGFIKHIRQFLNVGLKDAKHIIDDAISDQEFLKEYTFEEAKKLIIERF